MASIVLPEWLIPLAVTVALSFLVSAPLNRVAHSLYERLGGRLVPFERECHHPDEQPVSLGKAQVLIMGMGRTGTAAYDHLSKRVENLLAMDSDPAKVDKHREQGRNVFYANAEDQVFWQGLEMPGIKAVILSMNDVEAKVIAARQLRKRGFSGFIVSHTLYPDEARLIDEAGANETYLTMSEAGISLAEHIHEHLDTGGGSVVGRAVS